MSPAKTAALRTLVHVVDDSAAPGTLNAHLLKLERLWRDGANDAERARIGRLSVAEIASFSDQPELA